MKTKPTTINHEDARNVLWFYGIHTVGWEPGSFTLALIQTISRADHHNLAKLEREWPSLVLAMRLAMQSRGGLEFLESYVTNNGGDTA